MWEVPEKVEKISEGVPYCDFTKDGEIVARTVQTWKNEPKETFKRLGISMKILLHGCCGPCSIVPVKNLKEEGAKIVAIFDNPNVQPYSEWKKRHDAFASHMEREEVTTIPAPRYDITKWLRNVVHREARRCEYCYHSRLTSAAKFAKRGKMDCFSTTLLYSKFQKHALIKELGEAVAAEEGIPFYYRDWRDGWSEGVDESKRLGMYRQEYCGCVYSEEERYLGKKKGDDG